LAALRAAANEEFSRLAKEILAAGGAVCMNGPMDGQFPPKRRAICL